MPKSFSPKFAAFLILGTVILYPLFPVYAQDASRAGTLNRNPDLDTRQKLEQRRVDIIHRFDLARDKIASRQAQLRVKLAAFRDQQKAKIAERISQTLDNINQRHTTAMTEHLTHMSQILDRVDKKASDSANASASAQVAVARTAIVKAQAAVDAQSQKDYTINVTSETTVRADINAMRNKLFADLKAVRALVVSAKEEIGKAIRLLAIDRKGAEASPSGRL